MPNHPPTHMKGQGPGKKWFASLSWNIQVNDYSNLIVILLKSQNLSDGIILTGLQVKTLTLNSLWPSDICVSKLTIIGSDNGLSPDRRQAITWTNAGLLLIGPLGTNFSEILIEILTFSFKKRRLKVSSAKRRPFCLGLNVSNAQRGCQKQHAQDHCTWRKQAPQIQANPGLSRHVNSLRPSDVYMR